MNIKMDVGQIWSPWHLYHTCQGSWRRGERLPPNASSWPRALSPSSCISHMEPHTLVEGWELWHKRCKIFIVPGLNLRKMGTGNIKYEYSYLQVWFRCPFVQLTLLHHGDMTLFVIMELNFHGKKDQTNRRLKPGCQRRPSWTCPSRWTCRRW